MPEKRQTFLDRQHMLANDYEIYHYRDLCLAQVSTHHHDFYECLFFIGGVVTCRIEGRSFDLVPGDILFVNTSQLHQMVIRDLSIPYERIVLWLHRDLVRQLSSDQTCLEDCLLSKIKPDIIRTSPENQRLIRSLLERLLAITHAQGFGRDLLIRCCLTELLVNLIRDMQNSDRQPLEFVRRNLVIEGVIAYIDGHLDEKIQIDDLAAKFYLSKFHLSRKFREYTGTTIYRFIQQKKLIQARELLLLNTPAGEVSHLCGFGDSSTFYRAFRSEYGMTPRQFYSLSRRSG